MALAKICDSLSLNEQSNSGSSKHCKTNHNDNNNTGCCNHNECEKNVHICEIKKCGEKKCITHTPANLALRVRQENILRNDNPANTPPPLPRGVTPPDPIIAVGPKVLVVIVNLQIAIYRKDTMERLFLSSNSAFFLTGPNN